jgi:Fe2+ transport system protein B
MLENSQTFPVSSIETLLVGFESVGKSGLFREMTGDKSAFPQNVKGSTTSATKGTCQLNQLIQLTDLPGLQLDIDSQNMQTTLDYLEQENTLVLVVKAPRLKEELLALYDNLRLKGQKVAVIATHSDKYQPTNTEKKRIQELLQLPVIWINTRKITVEQQKKVIQCITRAVAWGASRSILTFLPASAEGQRDVLPLFRHSFFGPICASSAIFLMFALPVVIAYWFTGWLEPIVERSLLNPLITWLYDAPYPVQELLTGDYGLITLGSYSFLWAFPVVFLISIMTTLTEEIGLQEHLTTTLDPWLRKIGLTGRDLLPVITGFGCNVVAVFQSRGCSSCTRTSCVSLIAFGSACSYQIGATLSIFNAAKVPFLFVPYLFLLFIVGAIHTRIWHSTTTELTRVAPLPYIQSVNWQTFWWKIANSMKQFIVQAMPIFLIICFIASILQMFNLLSFFNGLAFPLLRFLSLPVEAAPGLLFSFIRKDGLLILNEGQGALLATISTSQLFVFVYLASTLSACLVTLLTIGKELGWKNAFAIASKQMITSIVSTAILAWSVTIF